MYRMTCPSGGTVLPKYGESSARVVHAGIVAPLLLYFASAGLRRRLERIGVRGVGQIQREHIVAHVQRMTVALLEGRIA